MIRKFYDMMGDPYIGAYKDVDGDWVEYRMEHTLSEQRALRILKNDGISEALRLYPEHKKLITKQHGSSK